MSFEHVDHCWEAALAGPMTPAIDAHLAGCPACARMVQGVEQAAAAVRAQIPPPPVQLDARVLDALARARAETPRRARRPSVSWPHAAFGRSHRRLTAAALTVVAGALAVGLWPGGAPTPSSAHEIPIGPLTAACSQSDGRLLVAGVWRGQEARGFAKVLARFQRTTGIRVSYAYETRDIATTLRARIERGCPPDVALLPQPGLLAELARDKQIQPLDAATRALVARNYGPSWRRLATVGSSAYGVWFKAADKSTFWYRAPALRAAGIGRPPRTWAELLRTARALRASRTTPLAIAGADGWTLTDWFENAYLGSEGAARYQRLAEHKIPWTDPSVMATLRRLTRLLGDPRLVGGSDELLHTSFEQSVARVFAAQPTAAMVFEGDFVRNFLPAMAGKADRPAAQARFFPFPGPRATARPPAVIGGDVAVAFNGRALSARLMRYLATPRAAAPWARAGGFLSPNRALGLDAYPDALTRRIAATLVHAKTVRFDLSDLQPPAFGAVAQQGMWAILQDLLRHPRSVVRTARRLEAAASAAWACERANRGRC